MSQSYYSGVGIIIEKAEVLTTKPGAPKVCSYCGSTYTPTEECCSIDIEGIATKYGLQVVKKCPYCYVGLFSVGNTPNTISADSLKTAINGFLAESRLAARDIKIFSVMD